MGYILLFLVFVISTGLSVFTGFLLGKYVREQIDNQEEKENNKSDFHF